jgi:hypothetical protein
MVLLLDRKQLRFWTPEQEEGSGKQVVSRQRKPALLQTWGSQIAGWITRRHLDDHPGIAWFGALST